MDDEKENKDIISIRGVNKDLYQKLSAYAKEAGMNIGEVINNAMAAFLATIEGIRTTSRELIEGIQKGMNIYIGDIDELKVEARDLEEVENPVILRNIKKLEISEDIDQELFNRKIKRIVNVDELVIHDKLSKFQVLARSFRIKRLTVRKTGG